MRRHRRPPDVARPSIYATELPLKLRARALPGVAVGAGFTPHRSGPNRSSQWRRLAYLSYNAFSEGGEQREQHYAEFKEWLMERYAEYGKTNVFFR